MDNVMEDLKEDRRNYRKLPVSLGLTVNLGYLPADCPTFNALVNTAEDRLLSSVIYYSCHVLRPLFLLSSPDDLASLSEPIHLPYPYKMISNVFPMSYLEPCFLLSSLGFTSLHQSMLL